MDQSGICLFFFSSFTTTTEGHYPSAVSTDPLYVFVAHSAMNLVDLQWLEVIVQRGF